VRDGELVTEDVGETLREDVALGVMDWLLEDVALGVSVTDALPVAVRVWVWDADADMDAVCVTDCVGSWLAVAL
jgi:hypothetical protein